MITKGKTHVNFKLIRAAKSYQRRLITGDTNIFLTMPMAAIV